ncbi:MAG: tetratricopeptide repeat protein [Spirochaetaceae bacterium]|nr:tetratricopeptide repeat protein [Spirochaetaceae bacterium]
MASLPSLRSMLSFLAPVVLGGLLGSCSLSGGAKIFAGVYQWRRGNYDRAEELFLAARDRALTGDNPAGDALLSGYARYGLGVTYLAQQKYAAALENLSAFPEDAPQEIRFAAAYNAGILAFRQGDYRAASEFFVQALKADSARVDAKINLELSRTMTARAAGQAKSEVLPGGKKSSPSVEDALFPLLREMDSNQWKNSQQEQQPSSVLDY